jgi:cysteine-rich repeat protein
MRHMITLGVLPFLACTIIIGNRQPIPCDGSEPRCDGDVLVQCTQDIVIKKECAPNSCDPAGLRCDSCGNAQLDANEVCDNGALNSDTAPDACRTDCTLPSCGDGITDPGRGEDCEPPNVLSCDANCQEISICGDGLTTGDEECDDSNVTSNDGCALCVLEADIFVLCDNAALGGSGTLADPFHRLSEAISAANTNDRIMILPQSLACAGTTINKSVSLFGLADPTAANPPPIPVIDGGLIPAVNINTPNLTVIVHDLRLQNNSNLAAVRVDNNAKVALLRTSITNSNGVGIDCILSNGGQLLLDQSKVSDSHGGGLIARNFCRAVLANSFFQNNGSNQTNDGAINIQNNNAHVDVLLSTFDKNITNSGPSVMAGCGNDRGRLDSSIINQNNTNTDGTFDALDNNCSVTFTNTFGAVTPGQGNLNTDPRFADDFSLEADSPCINAANPAAFTPLFNPLTTFGVDVFGHDFAGGVRPVGLARDMGMLEVQ